MTSMWSTFVQLFGCKTYQNKNKMRCVFKKYSSIFFCLRIKVTNKIMTNVIDAYTVKTECFSLCLVGMFSSASFWNTV